MAATHNSKILKQQAASTQGFDASNSSTLLRSSVGWLVPSLTTGDGATYSRTGSTVTVTATGHGLTADYNGAYVYLDIKTGTATDGWYSNFTYVDANSFTCTSVTSGTTSGALSTHTSATVITPVTTTIPGGTLRSNGAVQASLLFAHTNSSNNKTMAYKLGSSTVVSTVATTTAGTLTTATFSNVSAAKQVIHAVPVSFLTVDTAADADLSVTVTVAAASEHIFLSAVSFELLD